MGAGSNASGDVAAGGPYDTAASPGGFEVVAFPVILPQTAA
jgi:hypothetical protein